MNAAARLSLLAGLTLFAGLAMPALGDEGMWLLNKPPSELLRSKYGFETTPAWLEHMQKSCVRISSGGSGSIVSPDGLVMTNHHVGSDALENLSTPGHNLLETGFYAKTRADELKCPALEINCLWNIEDVTDRVNAAVKDGMSTAEGGAARRKMMSTIEKEAQDKTGMKCQVVTLYQGARYNLYEYKHYTDVRLVMAPEEQTAYFGGDTDNFEFPRYDLDMCFFRIYENDKPLKPEHYLKWSANGSKDNDLAFVFGHPGRTRRMNTVDHLKFMRDVDMPMSLNAACRREIQLQGFAGRSEENARIAEGDIRGVSNGRKANTGRLAGLQDPRIMNAKMEAEKALKASVDADPKHKAERAGAWDSIAQAEKVSASFLERRTAINGVFGSELARMGLTLVRLAAERPKPNADRLREFRDSELDSVTLRLYSTAPIYDALETERLANSLARMAELLGADDPAVAKALAGKSPADRAAELVSGTKLKDVAARKALVEGGEKAIAESNDPLIVMAKAFDAESRALRKRMEDEVDAPERDAYAKIAAAQFDAKGESVYPDATFTLRMSFGPVKGYREGMTDVQPFTTFAGLYERSEQRHDQPPFNLMKSWVDHKKDLDLKTPFNFVCCTDIIGGNSGSPVVNKNGEVIGLIFDGNIESLVGDFVYDERQNRAVAVDSRAIIEAMRKVYGAGALADEIVSKK